MRRVSHASCMRLACENIVACKSHSMIQISHINDNFTHLTSCTISHARRTRITCESDVINNAFTLQKIKYFACTSHEKFRMRKSILFRMQCTCNPHQTRWKILHAKIKNLHANSMRVAFKNFHISHTNYQNNSHARRI